MHCAPSTEGYVSGARLRKIYHMLSPITLSLESSVMGNVPRPYRGHVGTAQLAMERSLPSPPTC